METMKITLPKGWEIDKVENGEVFLKESKKGLPKTWEDCYRQLDKGEYIDDHSLIMNNCDINPLTINRYVLPRGLGKPMLALCQLLVCREIYRQGWRPNWFENSKKYIILFTNDEISTLTSRNVGKILSFQSAEIRDEFLKNFRSLIEEAKGLI